jgi:hypothetical protein
MRLSVAGLAVAALTCGAENLEEWNQPGVLSPNGQAKARLIKIDTVTQVFISFNRGRCGGGSVSTNSPDPDIALTLGGQGKTGHLSTLQNRPFPVSGIEAD